MNRVNHAFLKYFSCFGMDDEEILEEELENLQKELIAELSANTEAKIEQKIQEFSEKHNIIKVD